MADTNEKNMRELNITVDSGQFDAALQNAYEKNGSKYHIQGFRKGKAAPRRMIEKNYGKGVFYEDAFDICYEVAYVKAVAEADIIPVDAPQISITQIEEGKDLIFTAKVVIKPDCTLDSYKGLELEAIEYNVTDEQVDQEIERERETLARYETVDRPVENGDRIVFDYSGSIDGVKFDGGTAQNQTLDIGSGRFIPGFEEQLIGAIANESKSVFVKFPDEYHSEELKGKDAVFECLIHEIKNKELPELDDEFAKDVSEFNSLEELRLNKRETLEESARKQQKTAMENAALFALLDRASVDIPDAMIEREIDSMLDEMNYRLAMQGMNLETYLQLTNSDMNSMREQAKEEAQRRVKAGLVLEAVIKAENIEVTEQQIDEDVERVAKERKLDLELLKSRMGESDRRAVRNEIASQKALEAVLAGAVIKNPQKG